MPIRDDALSRRQFVGATAASLAAFWIVGTARADLASAPRVLDPSQLRDLDAITALILPTDDTAGAREARVVDFIDRALGSFAGELRPMFETGLANLSGFADRTAEEGTALLRQLEAEGSEFFEAVRVATITGFLADPAYGGNAGKVGWQAIGFEDRPGWSAPFGWYDAHEARAE